MDNRGKRSIKLDLTDLFWSPINSMEEIIGDDQFQEAGGLFSVPDGESDEILAELKCDG